MDRTYMLKHQANKGKLLTAIETIKAYRRTAKAIAAYQWRLFFTDGRFSKNADIKHLLSCLSERYKQTCQYQVVGMLHSFISNRQREFVDTVKKSSLCDTLKHKLLIINAMNLWYKTATFSTIKHKLTITADDFKLARCIFRGVRSRHRKPSFRYINMALDSKVALISEKQADKATSFDYWIRLSTVKKRDPVYIPIKSNNYYENIPGNRKNFCQFNLNRDGELTISFVKDVPKDDSYIPETPKIAIDIGLSTLFATDKGNLFGRDFMHRLVYYDNRISSLAANRQYMDCR